MDTVKKRLNLKHRRFLNYSHNFILLAHINVKEYLMFMLFIDLLSKF